LETKELQSYVVTFNKFVNEGQNVKDRMELVRLNIEDIVKWKEEYANAPNHPPMLSYMENKCFLLAYEKCKKRANALEEKVVYMFHICA